MIFRSAIFQYSSRSDSLDALVSRNARYAAAFVVTTSATSQIVHTKGGILDGVIGYEGSTNLSGSGEGVGIGVGGLPNAKGFKAQENTLMVFTNRVQLAKLAARIHYAAMVGRNRARA